MGRKFKVDVTGDAKAVRKLTHAAVGAKKILSTRASTSISVESLHDGMDFQSKVMQVPRLILITIVYSVVVFLTLFCIYLNLIFGTYFVWRLWYVFFFFFSECGIR